MKLCKEKHPPKSSNMEEKFFLFFLKPLSLYSPHTLTRGRKIFSFFSSASPILPDKSVDTGMGKKDQKHESARVSVCGNIYFVALPKVKCI